MVIAGRVAASYSNHYAIAGWMSAPPRSHSGVTIVTMTRTVLIMDDNLDILATLQDVLEPRGYRVRTAADGESGVADAFAHRPDLVIVDMLLPKLSGFLVIKKLRQRYRGDLPIVMISTNASGHHQAYAQSLGADEFIEKPFGLSDLLDAVHRLCPTDSSEPVLATSSRLTPVQQAILASAGKG